jgi:hypothetical protein
MGGVVDAVFGGGGDDKSGEKAAKVSSKSQVEAAKIAAKSQGKALDYLKEREELPQQFREEALTSLAGLYDLEGGEGDQQALIERAMNSPLYKALMGGRELGEESIMRNASATGGLRSGNVQGAMYDYNTQLQNQALLQSYNEQIQGLTGLASLPSGANAIAQTISSIGATRAGGVAGAGATTAQGMIADANAKSQGSQNAMGNLMGLGSLGIDAYASGMFSDRRLKSDIKFLGKIKGHNFYSFKWNKIGEALGLKGKTCGCMAEQVFDKNPEAVILRNGFMFVLYNMIGVL